MKLFGLEITRHKKALSSVSGSWWGGGGWWPLIHEPFGGAWQRNLECSAEDVLTFSTVQACVSLIAGDISKIAVELVRRTPDDIWVVADTNTAHWPVLRGPNHFQTPLQFWETWMLSKLIHGNTYALKYRDQRGIVTRLYVLDATRVKPLVADDGTLVYEIHRDNLAGVTQNDRLFVPASEIIHDRYNTFYHPLVGVSPLRACAQAASHGLKMQRQSETLFDNDAQPPGILTAATGTIPPEQAKEIQDAWQAGFTGANRGKVAVLGADLKYQQLAFHPRDLELISQLKMTREDIPPCFHIPPYKVGVAPAPPYNNVQALQVQYYMDCLQVHVVGIEQLLKAGLELPADLRVEFDEDSLLRMDTSTLVDSALKAIGSGGMSPNEARKRFFGLPAVEGGDKPYLQQQNFSLEALARRDAQEDPFANTPQDPQRRLYVSPRAPDPLGLPASGEKDLDEDEVEVEVEVMLAKELATT
jgi:HK97 family phage portal protein